MKIRALLLVTTLIASFAFAGDATETNISVSIAVPLNGEQRYIENIQRPGLLKPHFHVVISNISDKEQRIYGEGNSWGYDALSFSITDETGKSWMVRRKPISSWQTDAERFWTLKSQDSLVLDIYFSNTNQWIGFPSGYNLTKSVTMSAVFDIKYGRPNVWKGHVESKPDKYVFYDDDFSK
jgi:hypothetical protein